MVCNVSIPNGRRHPPNRHPASPAIDRPCLSPRIRPSPGHPPSHMAEIQGRSRAVDTAGGGVAEVVLARAHGLAPQGDHRHQAHARQMHFMPRPRPEGLHGFPGALLPQVLPQSPGLRLRARMAPRRADPASEHRFYRALFRDSAYQAVSQAASQGHHDATRTRQAHPRTGWPVSP